jgi:hypothetical protein
VADGRIQMQKKTGPGEENRPPLTPGQFTATQEFRQFKGVMRRLLKVPKDELDERVRTARAASPRAGNPKAPGRKANRTQDTG